MFARYIVDATKRIRPKTPNSKPLNGRTAKKLPKPSVLNKPIAQEGHAGAIIEGEKGTRKNKVKLLKEAGVIIAEVHHDVGRLMKEALQHGI